MSKDQSLADYLNEISASRDVVQQALRYCIGQESGDMPLEDMRDELAAGSRDASEMEIQLSELTQSSERLEEAALRYLSAAWADANERQRVRAALEAASKSLPVIESMAIATVGMYAMYVLATRGKARETRITVREADGSYKERVDTVYASPKAWLESVIGLFRRGDPPDDDVASGGPG